MKKILWITDDHKDQEELYKQLWKDIGKMTIIEEIKYLPGFDFVIVDYGCLNYLRNFPRKTTLDNVRILEEYYKHHVPIIWSGGFGGTTRYTDDCKRLFPDEDWLCNIKSVSLADLRWYVEKELSEIK